MAIEFLRAAALLAVITGPTFADDIKIDTATGEMEVPLEPGKIVVFDIAAADTLDALGVPIAGTINKMFVSYLDDISADAQIVGSLFEPDFEAVNALAPDLIIVGSRSSKQAEALSKFAPTVDMTVWGDDLLGQTLGRLKTYGKVFGKIDEAMALEQEVLAQFDAAKAAMSDRGNGLIVMTNGPKISAYGAGSRFGWLHTELGLAQAIENVEESTHGEAVSFEFIHDADPDWLIVIDRVAAIGAEGENAAQTLDNELIAQTKAWKSGQVVYLPSAPIYVAGGGVQSMQITLKALIDAFTSGS